MGLVTMVAIVNENLGKLTRCMKGNLVKITFETMRYYTAYQLLGVYPVGVMKTCLVVVVWVLGLDIWLR